MIFSLKDLTEINSQYFSETELSEEKIVCPGTENLSVNRSIKN